MRARNCGFDRERETILNGMRVSPTHTRPLTFFDDTCHYQVCVQLWMMNDDATPDDDDDNTDDYIYRLLEYAWPKGGCVSHWDMTLMDTCTRVTGM
jgi:hypothetical protein